ncbi:MAG: hypothetical protein LBQ79_04025 [Deltaproteobacteria bacterium]|nr:hypothetical protein [Deltaproteobacteria bacterium]
MPTVSIRQVPADEDPRPVIRASTDGEWRTQWKDDGFDYRGLLSDFRCGHIRGRRLVTISPFRTVHRVAAGERELVVKFDRDVSNRERKLEKRLFTFFFGTQYSRLINKTFAAIRKGCPVVQDVLLVSERMRGRFCEEAWSIAEYVPGHSFGKEEYVEGAPVVYRNPGTWLSDVGEALATLHDYGLASNDPIISNFVVTPEGRVKVIDLSLNGPMFVCQANDVVKIKRLYGAVVPVRGLVLRALVSVIGFWNRMQGRLRKLKGKPPNIHPEVIWEDFTDFPERPDASKMSVGNERHLEEHEVKDETGNLQNSEHILHVDSAESAPVVAEPRDFDDDDQELSKSS